ncbi:MAG: hypothetical protein AB1529_00350 [Candidatus Micrarchaeota archaeon]
MEIVLREYRPEDAPEIVDVFRDACNALRKSRGGAHPDEDIDRFTGKSDAELLEILERGARITVAEVKGTGRLAGIGAITVDRVARLIGSTYSKDHYVREEFQRGKAGVSVGRMLREATLKAARDMGFRKLYGYSTPEATGFHAKFGAIFHPGHDSTYMGGVRILYYETELRKSRLNAIRIEPYVFKIGRFISQLKLVAEARLARR